MKRALFFLIKTSQTNMIKENFVRTEWLHPFLNF